MIAKIYVQRDPATGEFINKNVYNAWYGFTKMGVWADALAASLADSDAVYCYTANLGWDAAGALASLGAKARCFDRLDDLVAAVAADARTDDHVLVMSNGGFGGVHDRLLETLAR